MSVSIAEQGVSSESLSRAYVWPLSLFLILEDIPEDVHWCIGLYGNTRFHSLFMDVADEFSGGGVASRLGVSRLFGGGRRDCGFVVEAVQIAAGGLEFGYPFLRLSQYLLAGYQNERIDRLGDWTLERRGEIGMR
jgi:hypothetical protein